MRQTVLPVRVKFLEKARKVQRGRWKNISTAEKETAERGGGPGRVARWAGPLLALLLRLGRSEACKVSTA